MIKQKKKNVRVNNDTQRQQRRLCTEMYHCCGPRAVRRRVSEEKTSSTHKYVKEKLISKERKKKAKVNRNQRKEIPRIDKRR